MTDPADALRDLANAMDDDGSAPAEPEATPEQAPERAPKPAAPPLSPHRPESPINPHPPAGSHRPESPIAREPHPVPVAHAGAATETDSKTEIELDELSLASASALAQLSGSTSAAYDPGHASTARRQRVPKPDTSMMQFRIAAVPVLVTVGLLMGALGLWGVLVKAGNTSLPGADRPDADNYALLALVGLPLALCMFAGAGFFLYVASIDRKKLKAYEEAKKGQRGK
ncbi:MAG: hypothetical protein ACE37H_06045 [Phycisphaeraceae bacterium]